MRSLTKTALPQSYTHTGMYACVHIFITISILCHKLKGVGALPFSMIVLYDYMWQKIWLIDSRLKMGSLHLWSYCANSRWKPFFIAHLLPQSVCTEIKWWWPTKHLWRGWKGAWKYSTLLPQPHSHIEVTQVFSYDSRCIQSLLVTYINSHGSPVEVTLWVLRLTLRENDENDDLDIQLESSGLFVCLHACVRVCIYMRMCMPIFRTYILYACFCLAFTGLCLSLTKGLRKCLRRDCQIRIRAALLICWKTSHVLCFWMERHSLTCLFSSSSWHISTDL